MFTAVDSTGKLCPIDYVSSDKEYFCPSCGESLLIKSGKIIAPHFSHRSGTNCDDFTNDMSEWHKSWQDIFPIDNRERVVELEISREEYIEGSNTYLFTPRGYKGDTIVIKHRADVIFNNNVIEFQHSHISCDEFNERNWFYNRAGYRVIWIFDVQEPYEDYRISLISRNYDRNRKCDSFKYKWDHPFKILSDWDYGNNDVQVYLNIKHNEFGLRGYRAPRILRVVWNIFDYRKEASDMKRFVAIDAVKNPGELIEHCIYNSGLIAYKNTY